MTVLIAAVGVAIFLLLNLPLPFLFGPMTATLVAALCRAPLAGLGQVSVAARSVLGVAIGTSVTPALVGELPSMLASVALVPVYIVLIALVGVPFFRRFCGFDPVTAFYAAMPGGAADMTIFGKESGGNVRQLSLVHVTRLMVIMVVAPVILVNIYGVSLTHAIGPPAFDLPILEMLIMAVAAIVGWKGGERIGLFGAAILGPLVVSAILSLAGILHLRPPREALMVGQFLIGMGIGVSYVGVSLRELRHTVTGGTAFVLILAALAGAVTELVTMTGLAPPVEGFLAFMPGGQAEMSMLALVSGADLSFVVVHHLTRILVVILGAPILFRFMRRVPRSD
ncbi:AbrB family transcriptional regulator [Rhizobium rhizogenes]|uniref:Aminopeptidase n=1 Tax=Rhizobium rhizogenes TaxID=359 RepID=A0AA92C099_RHIRH|nr:AbrB family transcriptional regulator [Rhizobium rhizogenes]PVE50675.1 aminopeptidase [Rhizobium rhizogenes]PVE62324.1 aminopeptidase [Agrobacterium tumefaciens]PVE70507.1 aminopeptidase [Sphingomonas sp. TPD3009]